MIYTQKRDCYKELMAFLHRDSNKVCVLYGLRRTGKTVLMKQATIKPFADKEEVCRKNIR
jgi:predicted AAA+ superfamily ATPase